MRVGASHRCQGTVDGVIFILNGAEHAGLESLWNRLLVGRSHEDNFPQSITHLPILTGQKTAFTTAGDVDKQVSAALSNGQSLYTLDVELLASLGLHDEEVERLESHPRGTVEDAAQCNGHTDILSYLELLRAVEPTKALCGESPHLTAAADSQHI